MFFSTFTSSRGKSYCKSVFFFPAHWIYISRCDPSEQRVCCILSGRRRIFHLQLLWSKEKKHFFDYLRLMLTVAVSAKTSRGKKQKGKPCSITPLVHACHCHWLGGWRNIWLPGKINERTKFKLIKQIRG